MEILQYVKVLVLHVYILGGGPLVSRKLVTFVVGYGKARTEAQAGGDPRARQKPQGKDTKRMPTSHFDPAAGRVNLNPLLLFYC